MCNFYGHILIHLSILKMAVNKIQFYNYIKHWPYFQVLTNTQYDYMKEKSNNCSNIIFTECSRSVYLYQKYLLTCFVIGFLEIIANQYFYDVLYYKIEFLFPNCIRSPLCAYKFKHYCQYDGNILYTFSSFILNFINFVSFLSIVASFLLLLLWLFSLHSIGHF